MVLVGGVNNQPSFSKVVSFFHQIPDIEAKFVRLYFQKSDKLITMTPRHLILVAKTMTEPFEYIPAADVQPENILKLFDQELNEFRHIKVDHKEVVHENSGIFSPLTESGSLIVDDIQVSCFSIIKSHTIAQTAFNVLNYLGYLIEVSADSYVAYAKFLYDFIDQHQLKQVFLNL